MVVPLPSRMQRYYCTKNSQSQMLRQPLLQNSALRLQVDPGRVKKNKVAGTTPLHAGSLLQQSAGFQLMNLHFSLGFPSVKEANKSFAFAVQLM